MRRSMESNRRIRLNTDRGKRWYCFLAAVFFAVGIFANLPLEDFGILAETPQTRAVLAADGGRMEPSERSAHKAVLPDHMAGSLNLTASKILDGVDDVLIAADTGSVVQSVLPGVRAADSLLFTEGIRQFFRRRKGTWRPLREGKRICRFLVVIFIHRTDGKKRTCFV